MREKERNKIAIGKDMSIVAKDAYKLCRTNLTSYFSENNCKQIIISSAMPGEGKSITVANLAISFAENGEKVLIIDANLRAPILDKFFQSNTKLCLVDLLEGKCLEEDVIGKTQYENIDIIGSKESVNNSTELIGSERMKNLLDNVRSKYKYILIDSVAINLVTDTIVLANLVPNILLVVRQNKTKHKDIKTALNKLGFVKAKVVGVILNDIGRENKKQK